MYDFSLHHGRPRVSDGADGLRTWRVQKGMLKSHM